MYSSRDRPTIPCQLRRREGGSDEESDENRVAGKSSVLKPAAKRQKKKEFKAKVLGDKSRRARQLHEDGSKVAVGDVTE